MENRFLKEIKEQPRALHDTLQYYRSEKGNKVLSAVYELWQSKKYEKIILTGMGSSFYISQSTATVLNHEGIPAFAFSASELLHYRYPIINEKVLLFCISQSGESYEIVQLIKKIPSDITVVAIYNERNSALAKRANYSLPCLAGKEEMTSTKTFLTTYIVAYLFTKALSNKGEIIDNSISNVIDEVNDLITSYQTSFPDLSFFFDKCQSLQFIARGTDFAIASQSALMFMEATKTFASAMLGGEFRHGPLEMIGEDFRGVLFGNSNTETYQAMLELINDILKYDGKVIFITNKKANINNPNYTELIIEGDNPILWAIPAIIPIQKMVIEWANHKKLTPGDFSHGAKVTIIE
jgi:glucosamine--fructose-6-phosphate aminotransferase (isomerizing)